MRAKKINELFNTINNNKWKIEYSYEDYIEYASFGFTSQNNHIYNIKLNDLSHIEDLSSDDGNFLSEMFDEEELDSVLYEGGYGHLHLEFADKKNGLGITGLEGSSAAQVFGIIINAILELLKIKNSSGEYAVSSLFFTAAEPNRQSLYNKIANILINKHNLDIRIKDNKFYFLKRTAKKINEFGGAGFSYSGASMSTSRPGGINRGGFSGANNLGGPNMMYTYEIKPLNRTLQPEANDTEGEESISKGNDISGAELNAKDNKLHAGVVMDIVSAEDGSLMYYVILNPDTSSQMRIDPTTARLISKLDGVDPLGTKLSPEEESLVNPGNKSLPTSSAKNESFKLVKEGLWDKFKKRNEPNTPESNNSLDKTNDEDDNLDSEPIEPINYNNWLDEPGSPFAKNLFKWLSDLTDKYDLDGEDQEFIVTVFMKANRFKWGKNQVYRYLGKYDEIIENPKFIDELFNRFHELRLHSSNI